jgi:hypothetical protein
MVVFQIPINLADGVQAILVIQVSANSGSHKIWCADCTVAAIASCLKN